MWAELGKIRYVRMHILQQQVIGRVADGSAGPVLSPLPFPQKGRVEEALDQVSLHPGWEENIDPPQGGDVSD